MKPLNICMVTTFYPPYNFGGDGIFVYRLTNVLASQGHTVHVIYDLDAFALFSDHQPRQAYPNHPNVFLHPLSSKGGGPVDLVLSHQLGRPVVKRAEIKAILEHSHFDVIHFHNISLLGGPHILRYGAGAVKLCTMHDYWFVCAMHVLWRFDREACTQRTCLACSIAGHRPPQAWRYTGSVGRAARSVDAFITPSAASRDLHQRNGFPAPIEILPYFLPDREVPATPDELPDEAAHHSARPYFLFVGRLEKIKGLQILLDVMRTYPDADLLVAGVGAYETTLRAQAEGLPNVRFLGFLDHDALRPLYRDALAAIVPSICFETFGWISLEAFGMHTPVIVNNIGALPEVARAGGGIVYNTPDELRAAMHTLQADPALRAALGERGYAMYITNYTESQHLTMYYDLIADRMRARQHGTAP